MPADMQRVPKLSESFARLVLPRIRVDGCDWLVRLGRPLCLPMGCHMNGDPLCLPTLPAMMDGRLQNHSQHPVRTGDDHIRCGAEAEAVGRGETRVTSDAKSQAGTAAAFCGPGAHTAARARIAPMSIQGARSQRHRVACVGHGRERVLAGGAGPPAFRSATARGTRSGMASTRSAHRRQSGTTDMSTHGGTARRQDSKTVRRRSISTQRTTMLKLARRLIAMSPRDLHRVSGGE